MVRKVLKSTYLIKSMCGNSFAGNIITMTRRDLLKNAALCAGGVVLPGRAEFEQETRDDIKPQAAGFFEFKLGELNLLVVADGHAQFRPVQPTFAPAIPTPEVEQVLKENFVPTDHVDLGFNILVIKKDQRLILFDTGCGTVYGKQSGKLVANLIAAGI